MKPYASCAAAFAATLLLITLPAADTLPPLENFLRADVLQLPEFSPDGKKLAYISTVNAKEYLVCLDLESKAAETLLEVHNVDTLVWKGSDLLVVSEGGYPGNVFTIELKTHKARPLKAFGVLLPLVGNPDKVLLDQSLVTQEIEELNVRTGESEVLFADGGTHPTFVQTVQYCSDSKGLVRARLSLDSKDITLEARGVEGNPPHASLNFTAIKRWPLPRIDPDLVGFGPGDESVYLVAPDEQGRSALYAFDLAERKLGRPVLVSEKADLLSGYYTADGKKLLGVRGVDHDGNCIEWLDEGFQKLQAKLESSFPGMKVDFLTSTPNGKQHIIRTESGSSPGGWYFLDLAKPSLQNLAMQPLPAPAGQLGTTRAVDFPASDGLTLHAILTVPPGPRAAPAPLLIWPIDTPFQTRYVDGYNLGPQYWASRGYAVLNLNYRGAAGYGSAYRTAGNGQIGGRILEDINDAARWAIQTGVAQPKRICVCGEGIAGGMAIVVAAEHPELYRCAVNISGVTAWHRMTDQASFGRFKSWYAVASKDLAQHTPLKVVSKLQVAVLNVFPLRANDDDELRRAFKSAGKEFLQADYEQGDFTSNVRTRYLLETIEPFVRKQFASTP
jgi:dipeptidyl aminopeptidase/acylaminoacyl peptidase